MIKKVLDVKIDDISENDALEKVIGWLDKKEKGKLIVTPGPEFILTAQKDQGFKEILNKADLSVPDGFGLHLAGIKNWIPGTDLMIKLLELAAKNDWSVGLVARNDGLTSVFEMEQFLRKKYPNLVVKRGVPCDLLLVAIGHPEQEKFLAKSTGYRVGMGVGGGFDYFVGRLPRAPQWFRNLGLEWIIRLVNQPNRIKRILRATVEFPIRLMLFWIYGKICSRQ